MGNCFFFTPNSGVEKPYWFSRAHVLQEYIRLYKKKFNGPQSSFHWRRSLPPLTAEVGVWQCHGMVREWCGINWFQDTPRHSIYHVGLAFYLKKKDWIFIL